MICIGEVLAISLYHVNLRKEITVYLYENYFTLQSFVFFLSFELQTSFVRIIKVVYKNYAKGRKKKRKILIS